MTVLTEAPLGRCSLQADLMAPPPVSRLFNSREVMPS